MDRVDDPNFRKPFANMLAKLDILTPADAYEIVRKAEGDIGEIRHSIDPRYVTDMVFGMLRAIGSPIDGPKVYKHMRDDVLWSGVFAPWRRSPLWTVLRVAIQSTLMRCNEAEKGLMAYKQFMAYFMAGLLDHANTAKKPSDTLHCMQTKVVRRLQKIASHGMVVDPSGMSLSLYSQYLSGLLLLPFKVSQ